MKNSGHREAVITFFYLEVSINSNIPAVRQASGSKKAFGCRCSLMGSGIILIRKEPIPLVSLISSTLETKTSRTSQRTRGYAFQKYYLQLKTAASLYYLLIMKNKLPSFLLVPFSISLSGVWVVNKINKRKTPARTGS